MLPAALRFALACLLPPLLLLQGSIADGPGRRKLDLVDIMHGSEEDAEVRFVEGIPKVEDTSTSMQEPYQTPDPVYGPEALFFLDGLCFHSSHDKYEYTVCPFQNVTQRRLTNARPVLLGVWGKWQDDTTTPFSIMQYERGLTCGTHDRTVKVLLQCGHDKFAVIDSDEPVTCSYVLTFGIPIPCGVIQGSNVVPRLGRPAALSSDTPTSGENAGAAAAPESTSTVAAAAPTSPTQPTTQTCDEALQTAGRCLAAPQTLPENAKTAVLDGARSYANEELSREALLHLAAQFDQLRQQLNEMANAVQDVGGA